MNLALLEETKWLLRPEGFVLSEEDTELVPTTNLTPAITKCAVAGSEQGPKEPWP